MSFTSTFARHRLSTPLALAIAAALPGMALSTSAFAQQASAAAVMPFAVPAQALDRALTQLADQGGVRILFVSSDVAGQQAPAVQGAHTPGQALDLLLAGSGLRWQWRESGVIVLSRDAIAGAGDPIVTGTLNVAGQQAGSLRGAQRDLRGQDDVYDLDLSSVYAGREQIERYKGAAPADVFKGMVNVYSGDARNSGALDPNIRGIQGPGRVPVSIDGTEQALTVWRGYMGANNRNYIDPNLIGGIQVIKGPQLQRNVNTSVGGAVVINTLDVDDILREGESFGGEVKVEASNNAVSPRLPTLLTGQKWREVPGWPTATWNYYDPSLYVTPRGEGSNHLLSGDDQAYRVALGWRQPRFDVMVAYAYRDKGNHYAGKRDAGYYSHPAENGWDYIPYLANIYRPGDEVPNSSSTMESWLGKFTYRITDSQVLQLGVRDTLSHYGEIMPSRIAWVDAGTHGVPQWPLSRVDAKAYNLEYKWQPQGSRWIDLYANLWQTDTVSDTYSSGGRPNDSSQYIVPNATGTGGRNVASTLLRNTAVANADNTRKGLTLSNSVRLRDDLQLVVGGNYQHESLSSDDSFWDTDINSTLRMLPRAGRRAEKDLNLKLEWRPFERLSLTGGLRYQSFWAVDDFARSMARDGYTNLSSSTYYNFYGLSYYTPPASMSAADVQAYRNQFIAQGLSGAALESALERTVYTQQHIATWRPDADGKYSRAGNVFLNGSLDGVDYRQGSASQGLREDGGYATSDLTRVSAEKRKSGNGWAPSFSAAFHLDDYARVYFLYNQTRRYPSLFESTLGFSASVPTAQLKPEHVYSYELGYVHDLSSLLNTGAEGHADLKLAYYHHRTEDVIERDPNLRFSNLDHQTLRGIELQGRYDNGRFFADLSAARTLENRVCDEHTAVLLDPVKGGVRNCVDNGFVGGYLVTQAIPDWTVNALAGVRLLDRKLEIGGRGVYYSAFDNPYEGNYGTQTMVPYYANTPMQWGRILTYDAYVSYRPIEALTLELIGTNLGNLYYIDPLTRSAMAAPGRTVKLSMSYRF
ncbi:TonB-dependent receptor [Stenotrophomonas maltophilia]